VIKCPKYAFISMFCWMSLFGYGASLHVAIAIDGALTFVDEH